MTAARARLVELLDALSDEQLEIVSRFAEALSNGRAVVSSCDVPPPGVTPSRLDPAATDASTDH